MSPSDPLSQLAAPPVFVGGHERSGTTWVFDLLTAHPEVTGLFETWMFSPAHGIGGVFAREQWDDERISEAGAKVGRPFGLHQMLGREELVAQIRSLVGGWMSASLQPEHRFIVEKTPAHLLGMDLIAEVFPGARFVHVVRDGRDVAVSVRAAAATWNPGLSARFGRTFADAARSWRSTVEAIATAGARRPDKYIEVRYEDLHADVDAALDRLFRFCGIEADPPLIKRIAEAARFDSHEKSGGDSFRRAGRTGDWRTEMNVVDALRFDRAAGDTLVRLGYEAGTGWWRPRLGRKRDST